ncbi:MAG: site-2 protease family protein [Pirellulales bacterium]
MTVLSADAIWAAMSFDRDLVIVAVAWYFVFVMSTVLHEAAHALAAWKLGDPTAYEGGQVSINPLPHIEREPIGMVVVPLISLFMYEGRWLMGWASAPYDVHWALAHPKRAAAMAMAGPASNFILAALAACALKVGLEQGFFVIPKDLRLFDPTAVVEAAGPGAAIGAAKLLSIMFSLNLILGVFNLLPLPPLDGSAIVPLLISREGAAKYRHYAAQPAFWMIGMLIAWNIFPRVFFPIFITARNAIYG